MRSGGYRELAHRLQLCERSTVQEIHLLRARLAQCVVFPLLRIDRKAAIRGSEA